MTGQDLAQELERLHSASFSWALSCCRRDREEAGEVLQASYLKVLEGRARFAGQSSFKTFLFGVIRRTAAEQRRRRLLQTLWLERWGRAIQPAGAADESPVDLSQGLDAALVLLPRRQREVIELRLQHEMTIEEAASALSISIGSARVHYTRAKERLRRLLAEKEKIMNPHDDSHETELRRLFAERERRDEAAAPSYERVIHRPARARHGRRRLALAACAAGVLLFAVLAVWKDRPRVAPAPALSTWKAPTDFLLAVPGGDLLNSTPNLPDLRRL